ncbi:class I SAM-dependent methyltransferase [Acetobacterium woodii]|uniref:Menaquinone biosynthesis methyltransferase n=1 Tax=Acetobacterium woodii (strain ATCC 29683 / DSM 1030 / JCM 2381 / KCTC 1655 / WB1) TaxID=931626 RepID=H6LEB8_ACEWD|nr:class I SAM-dependent methyltransferase [Acetobacterium woodii]AFA46832.1 menaquinone biosynthesis methyltransferase [Acetobacterium woodii DSM 1030]
MEVVGVIKKIEAYWDKRSDTFDADHDTEDVKAWMDSLANLLGPETNRNVLDLGTGTGFLANMTANLGYSTIGIDISKEMMNLAVKHAKNLRSDAIFMEGSVLSLPFMDNTIDFIINARLIWTLIEPDVAIKEWLRILKPGGKIMCFNRMKEGVGLNIGKVNIYEDEEVDKQLAIKEARMEELRDLLERNGLSDVKIQKIPGLTRPGYDYDPWFVLMGTKVLTECSLIS